MNKTQELAKNTAILTVGKICTQFISFFLLPLYTALLSTEEYGIVDLFNTYILLLVPLFNWQFENGLFRFMLDCRNDDERNRTLFSTVLTANFFQVIIYIIFFLSIQKYIHSAYKFFLLIDVVINIILNTLLQFSRGLGKNPVYAFASFMSASTAILFNVILIAGLRLGAYGMFIATVVSKIIALLYLFFYLKVWKYYSVVLFNRNLIKEIGRYSFPLIPNQLSWWIIGTSDRSIISKCIGLGANGIYSVANKFSGVYSTFFTIFNMSWTESVSLHMQDMDRDYFLAETINNVFKLFAAICFGIISCMPFVFPILINEKYIEAYPQIPILLIAILFQVLMGLYSAIYVALKKSIVIARTTVGAAAINIGVDILTINFIGIYAGSVSTLIAFAFVAVYRYYDVQKFVNVRLEKMTIIKIFIIAVISLSAYYYNKLLTNIIALVIIVSFAVEMNWKIIKSAWILGIKMIKRNDKSI